MFLEKLINNKRIYYSDILKVEHFFTSRDFLVKENKKLVADYLNIEEQNLIKPTQTHSNNIEILEENKTEYPNCDGLILDKKGYAIFLNFADCTPVILYDKENNIGAIVHAGWRGTAQNIASCAVEKMEKIYNTKACNIIAVIGPAIGFESFETSKVVIDALSLTVENKEGLFSENHADLKGINARQLIECGVENIDICPYCTVKDNDKFFSYRKEDKTKNRHSAVLKL